MRQDLYFDINRKCYLIENDFVPYSSVSQNAEGPFIHSGGFPIFLSMYQLNSIDEYDQGDPYGVQENIHSEFHKRRISVTTKLVKSVALPQSKILDLGCGEGYITNEISKVFHNICGLDYSLIAIETAKSKFPDVEFCVGDACSPLFFSEHYFDIVICNNLWEHVEAPLNLLRQIRHVLKDRGFLIISTPSRYRLGNLLRIMIGKPMKLISKNHVTEYTIGQMIEILNYGNFDVVDITSQKINQINGMKSFIIYKVIGTLFQWLIKKIISHHSLESTVFFLTQKRGYTK